MSKRARPPELEGIGVDGLPYQVKQDGKATKSGRKYRIFFGPGLRGAIRFPPGQELTHENTITALRRRASNSGQRPNLAAGTAAAAAPATRDAAVVAEGHTFVGPAGGPPCGPIQISSRPRVPFGIFQTFQMGSRIFRVRNISLFSKKYSGKPPEYFETEMYADQPEGPSVEIFHSSLVQVRIFQRGARVSERFRP